MGFLVLATVLVLARLIAYRFSHILWPKPVTSGIEKVSVVAMRSFDCPYDYLLNIYGSQHFRKIVSFLNPGLQDQDAKLYGLVLEILDAVHFGAILVDDIADNSMLRKSEVAAHRIYGSSETINRAYLKIFDVITKCQKERPELMPFILESITEIHQGISVTMLNWRKS